MALPVNMSRFAIAFTACALAFGQPAAAQEVVLKGKDSQLNISGELLSAANGMFVVKTAIGEFAIEQSLVTCEGDACPKIREITYDLNLVGVGDIAEVLLPFIAEGFAATKDAEALLLDANGNEIDEERAASELSAGGKIDVQVTDYEGKAIASIGIIEADGKAAFDLLASGEAPIIFTDDNASIEFEEMVAAAGGGDLEANEQDHVIAEADFALLLALLEQ